MLCDSCEDARHRVASWRLHTTFSVLYTATANTSHYKQRTTSFPNFALLTNVNYRLPTININVCVCVGIYIYIYIYIYIHTYIHTYTQMYVRHNTKTRSSLCILNTCQMVEPFYAMYLQFFLSTVHNRAHITQCYHYKCDLLLHSSRKLQVRCARRSCSTGRPYLTSPTHPVEIFRNCRFTSNLLYTI